MEKPEKEREAPEPCDPSEAQVGEEMAENEPQEQQVPESQMQDEQISSEVGKETENETSAAVTGSASYENEQILQSKIEQDEESKQNVPEEFDGSAGMKRKLLDRDCENRSTVQENTQIQKDTATEDLSEPSGKINYKTNIGIIVGRVMSDMPVEPNTESSIMALMASVLERSEETRAPMEEEQVVPGTDSCSETGSESESEEESEPESSVREAQQLMELVLEEAAVCYARQEPMEEAEDIEEPQKCAFREKKLD